MAHAFNPSTWEAEAGSLYDFEVSLVYRKSSWTVRAAQRNTVSKNKSKQTTFLLAHRSSSVYTENVDVNNMIVASGNEAERNSSHFSRTYYFKNCVFLHTHTHARSGTEDSLQELVLSSQQVVPRD